MRTRGAPFTPLGVAAVLATGCYTYTPMATTPAPATELAVDLTDRGRVYAAPDIGPAVTRVEGSLIDVTDTGYVLAVRSVMGLSGERMRWSGERVALPREYVARTFERRFSRSRTTVIVGGVLAAVGAFFLSKDLLGFGGGSGSDGPDDGGGNGQ